MLQGHASLFNIGSKKVLTAMIATHTRLKSISLLHVSAQLAVLPTAMAQG